MTTKIKFFIIFLLASWLYNCNSNININPEESKNKITENIPICIVFCDFTSSEDFISKNKIIDNAVMILKQIGSGYNVSFYSINNLPFQAPIFTSSPPPAKTTIEKINSSKRINQRCIELKKVLDSVSATSTKNESCIIKSVEKAIIELDNYNASTSVELKLVFLSDMIEDCNSSMGDIDLDHENYKAATQKVEKASHPNLSFMKFKNLQTYIIVATDHVKNGIAHYEFWRKVFAKYQYGNLHYFYSSLPKL
jgi:hypothetical protein